MRRLTILAALLAACSASAPPPPTASQGHEIVRGEPDYGDPAVVALLLGGAGLCSGTIVTPRTILTAAHCVAGVDQGDIEVMVGQNLGDLAAQWYGTVTHEAMEGADIAMITLRDPSPVTPVPIYFDSLVPLIGDDIRIVGFGVTTTQGSDSGVKRMGDTRVHHFEDDIMYHGYNDTDGVCFGDSGGPNFATIDGTEYVVAVHSFVSGGCGGGGDGSVRTDTTKRFMLEYIAKVEDALPPELTVESPADGASVAPETLVEVTVADDWQLESVRLEIDGVYASGNSVAPYSIALPASLALGPHTLTVVAKDWAKHETAVDVDITLVAGCQSDAECSDATESCIDGRCVRGLGAPCNTHGECATGECNVSPEGGGHRGCTQACGSGDSCPDGFSCLSAGLGAAPKCWPGVDGGGCRVAAGARSGHGPAALLLLLGIAAVARRRRDRR